MALSHKELRELCEGKIFTKLPFVDDPNIEAIMWKLMYMLKEVTDTINYDCRFKDDKCKAYKNTIFSGKGAYDAGHCCWQCKASDIGFRLGTIKVDENVIKEIFDMCDTETGFFRHGKGCILPRKYRCTECLTYSCRNDNNFSPYERKLLALVEDLPGKIYTIIRTYSTYYALINGIECVYYNIPLPKITREHVINFVNKLANGTIVERYLYNSLLDARFKED